MPLIRLPTHIAVDGAMADALEIISQVCDGVVDRTAQQILAVVLASPLPIGDNTPGWTRTNDQSLRRRLLYSTELRAHLTNHFLTAHKLEEELHTKDTIDGVFCTAISPTACLHGQ